MYSIHPKSLEERLAHAGQRTAELKAWKDTLPAFLEPTKVDPSILVPIFQRQSTVLTLAYAHALILANRQFLLSNFVDLTRPASSTDERVEFHIQECVEAALVAVNTVSTFVEHRMLYRTFGSHNIFHSVQLRPCTFMQSVVTRRSGQLPNRWM